MNSRSTHVRQTSEKMSTTIYSRAPGPTYFTVQLEGTVEVWIDWAKLFRLYGTKALRSRSGTASGLGGSVRLKCVDLTRTLGRAP